MATIQLVTENDVIVQVSGEYIILQIPDFESPACSQFIEIYLSDWDAVKAFIDGKINK